MPPQFPNSRVKSTPATAAFSSSIAAAKKPSSISSQSPAKKIMARPTSAPASAAVKKIARPTSSSNLALAAPSAAKLRPPPSNSKTVAAKKPDAPSDAKPRPPSSNSRTVATNSKKPARPSSEFSEPPVAAVTRSVHPARRLTCGTAVYVRTRYVKITARCCLVIWLPARVVSSSDAYHYTVKYAADLHALFAGRVVRVPVGHVRPAPHRAAAAAERSIW